MLCTIYFALFLISRLEYEQKRDVESRISRLESSLVTLENDLKEIQNKEADVKSSTEKATSEINRWKEEVRGMNFLACFHTIDCWPSKLRICQIFSSTNIKI